MRRDTLNYNVHHHINAIEPISSKLVISSIAIEHAHVRLQWGIQSRENARTRMNINNGFMYILLYCPYFGNQ